MADEENEDELTPTRGSPLANGETMTNNTSTRMNNTDPPLHPNQNFHSFSQLPFTNQHNNNNTSNLLTQILQNRTIQYADQIFCLSDYDIIMELVTNKTLVQLKNIFNECQYARNVNDQSVVELVLSRITAAIRETNCIETYAPSLVDVLESALAHKMFVITTNGNLHSAKSSSVYSPDREPTAGNIQDSPHCKIALELLSTLFLYHSKKSVMTVAIPVAIKALSSLNQELVRNTTSYLSLAVIHNAAIIAKFSFQIVTNILNGNYSLIRVLPQVYPENREPFHAHLSQLLRLLHNPNTEIPEKLSLLQFSSMVTNSKPDLIISHLSEFDDFLISNTTCTAVLHIFLSLISMGRVSSLVGQLRSLRRAAQHHATHQNHLATIGKIVGIIGRCGSEHTAIIAVQDIIDLCRRSSQQNLPILLKEIEGVAEIYPSSVSNHLITIKDLSHRHSSYSAYQRIRSIVMGEELRQRHSSGMIDNGSSGGNHHPPPNYPYSVDSLHSSAHNFPNDPTPKQENASVRELDALVESYKMRSNGSLGLSNPSRTGNPSRCEQSSRSFLSLANPNNVTPNGRNNDASAAQTQVPTLSSEVLAKTTPDNRVRNSMMVVEPGSTYVNEPPPTIDHHNPHQQQHQRFHHHQNQQQFSPPLAPFYRDRDSNAHHQQTHHHHHLLPPSATTTTAAANHIAYQHHQIQQQGLALPPPQQQQQFSNKSPLLMTEEYRNNDGREARVQSNQRILHPPLPSFEETTIFPVNAASVPVKATTPKASSIDGCFGASVCSVSSPKSASTTVATSHNNLHALAPLRQSARSVKNDVVYQFVDHRQSKIKRFISELTTKFPIPQNCTLESSKGRKRSLHLHFSCQMGAEHCVFGSKNHFTFKTKLAPIWMHLIFLQKEVATMESTGKVLTQESEEFQNLSYIWQCLPKRVAKSRRFVNLVTSAFPPLKAQSLLLKELEWNRYFDCFQYNAQARKWSCLSCAYPEKTKSFLRFDMPLIEGQLKEKHGRLRWFRPWQTKYFTLSSAALTSSLVVKRRGISTSSADLDAVVDKIIAPSIELQKIRLVKSLSRNSRKNPKLLKYFEILTDENRLLLKASDRAKADEWFKCLQIAVAQSQREKPFQIL